MQIDKEKLQQIVGGGWGAFAVFASLGAIIVGVFDGFLRPYPCRK